jgi:hypothetical protein
MFCLKETASSNQDGSGQSGITLFSERQLAVGGLDPPAPFTFS